MMYKRTLTIGLCLLLLAVPQAGTTQGSAGDDCRTDMNLAASSALREYRAVLFGEPSAEDAPLGHTRYSSDGSAWIRTGASPGTPWESVSPGYEGTQWSNDQMDNQAEFPAVRGIFDTPKVTTSELIPYLLQAVRAFSCQLEYVCATAVASLGVEGDAPELMTIGSTGCKPVERQSFSSCTSEASTDVYNYCPTLIGDTFDREVQLLKLAVEYDAAYRSLLQFAGDFDLFLTEFRHPLTSTLRQAAYLIGQLGRIPCFASSCDDFTPVGPEPEPVPEP